MVFPPNLQGSRVLDLGSGAGRDVYILSSLVGDQGYVVGVDMTKEQVNRISYYHLLPFALLKSARRCQSFYRLSYETIRLYESECSISFG